jgi:hypothetical protein
VKLKCAKDCSHIEDCQFDHDPKKCIHAIDVNAPEMAPVEKVESKVERRTWA